MSFAKYKVIHWYMDKLSLEFLNIGVVAFDDYDFKFRLIDNSLIKAMSSANFINRKILAYTAEYIGELLAKVKNERELEQALSKEYFDNFRFSRTQLFSPFSPLDIEIDALFERYVGYKFDDKLSKPHNANREHIKQAVKELAEKEFKNYVKFSKRNGFDFSLILQKREYPSILGSIENKEDISRAFSRQLEIPEFKGIYGITNTVHKNTVRVAMFKDTLLNIGYRPMPFADKEQIQDSLEKLLVVA
ncbi:hypothetical protein ACHJH3_01850 [Campylobacter sp. MOP7]|uniref:hypothetical protein n=1 Tax=Campylobacter canis TaxID=3378588 RepID=UPI00387EA951